MHVHQTGGDLEYRNTFGCIRVRGAVRLCAITRPCLTEPVLIEFRGCGWKPNLPMHSLSGTVGLGSLSHGISV